MSGDRLRLRLVDDAAPEKMAVVRGQRIDLPTVGVECDGEVLAVLDPEVAIEATLQIRRLARAGRPAPVSCQICASEGAPRRSLAVKHSPGLRCTRECPEQQAVSGMRWCRPVHWFSRADVSVARRSATRRSGVEGGVRLEVEITDRSFRSPVPNVRTRRAGRRTAPSSALPKYGEWDAPRTP